MKKQILIATCLAFLSANVFATKSRMIALGQDEDTGSYYFSDTRNIFSNPAAINSLNNYITAEWEDKEGEGESKGEGGFFRNVGSLSYGIYLGSDLNDQNSNRVAEFVTKGTKTVTTTTFQKHDNAVDLFLGGDMGVMWGARLHFARGMNDPKGTSKMEHTNMGLGFGVVFGDIEAYANLTLKDESKGAAAITVTEATDDDDVLANTADMFEGSHLNVGASYTYMGSVFFADIAKSGYERSHSAREDEQDVTTVTLGAGRIHRISSMARLNLDLMLVNKKTETMEGKVETEVTNTTLPLTIGFEADAASWLTLRGSVSQKLVNKSVDKDETETTGAESTKVTAGATLSFGKLKLDGSIGSGGMLNGENLLAQVGVFYRF